MSAPRLEIDLQKISYNAKTLVDRLSLHGIQVTGVTKATLGSPEIGEVLINAGVSALGDSRIENIKRMRGAGISTPITLIRAPMYDRKHGQLIQRRQEVQEQLERHNSGDEEFRMAVSTLVSIASKALDIFDRSTTDEKRQLIGYVFSNLELKGAKLCYTLKTPFDLLVNLTSYQKWQRLQSVANYSHANIYCLTGNFSIFSRFINQPPP